MTLDSHPAAAAPLPYAAQHAADVAAELETEGRRPTKPLVHREE